MVLMILYIKLRLQEEIMVEDDSCHYHTGAVGHHGRAGFLLCLCCVATASPRSDGGQRQGMYVGMVW